MSFHATKKLKFCYRVKLWFGSYCFLFWIFYQNRGLVQPNILSSQFARIKSREINSSYAEARIPLTNKKKNPLRTGRSVISSNKPVSHTRTWFPLGVLNYVASFENLKKYIWNFSLYILDLICIFAFVQQMAYLLMHIVRFHFQPMMLPVRKFFYFTISLKIAIEKQNIV